MKYIDGTIVVPFLNVHHLHLQALYFKMTMKKYIKYVMKPLVDLNRIIEIWQNLTSFQVFVVKIFEYFKVVEVDTSLVIGFILFFNIGFHEVLVGR
jgi:hypothetical protein